jgi:hypothetical protein
MWKYMKDFKILKLSKSVIMNTWCDREANEARKHYITLDAEVYSAEWWDVFTTEPKTQKITGKLDDCILTMMHGIIHVQETQPMLSKTRPNKYGRFTTLR